MAGRTERRHIRMWSKFSGKTFIFIFFLFITILVTSNVITYRITCKDIDSTLKISNMNYIVEYRPSLPTSGTSKINITRFVSNIKCVYNANLEEKININLRSEFLDWMPEEFVYLKLFYLRSTLVTDRFLSITTEYTFSGKYPNKQRIS